MQKPRNLQKRKPLILDDIGARDDGSGGVATESGGLHIASPSPTRNCVRRYAYERSRTRYATSITDIAHQGSIPTEPFRSALAAETSPQQGEVASITMRRSLSTHHRCGAGRRDTASDLGKCLELPSQKRANSSVFEWLECHSKLER